MIFLLNAERVRYEVIELTRLRIAGLLKIDPAKVEVQVAKSEDGSLERSWLVKELPEGVSEERAREACVAVARYMMAHYLAPRLADAAKSARQERDEAAKVTAEA